jgi:phosphohistidine swiveling domain-containing protein
MSAWLLSGHNPRETFGIMYPITGDYFAEFMARRQYEYLLGNLAGDTSEFDLSMPGMVVVQGFLYVNISSVMRNLALVLPADPASLGAPNDIVPVYGKPRMATQLLLPFRAWKIYRQIVDTYRSVIPRYRKMLDEIYWHMRKRVFNGLKDEDLTQLERLFQPATIQDATGFLNVYNIVTVINIAISKLVDQKAPGLLNLLVGKATSTAQLGEHMWELCQIARQNGIVLALLKQGASNPQEYIGIPEFAPLAEAIRHFMRTYGHRSFCHASQFESTRLADQPELLLLTIAGLLDESEPPTLRAEAARKASYHTLQQMNPFRRYFWQRLLTLGGRLVELREENRDTLELQNATYGLAASLLSRHYFPNEPADYLWLYRFDEFLDFGQSHGEIQVAPEIIAQRRAGLEKNRRQTPPPELIWYDPETKAWWPVHEERIESTKTHLKGIGVSAGSGPVEGVAVVSNSAQEAAERLLSITGPVVLVTTATDPVWSSLFRRLTAVVTEMGGVISHAAIVARESGIPAVVGTSEATHLIQDGQWVRVDGAAGVVELIEGV